MTSTPSCRPPPVALGPLEASSASTSSSRPPSPPRGRRLRRVLYPACQSRRPRLREAPDQARRWLMLLSALVFLQIYTEETHTCTELQSPEAAASQLQEGEGSLGTTGEESWRVQMVASETQPECVAS